MLNREDNNNTNFHANYSFANTRPSLEYLYLISPRAFFRSRFLFALFPTTSEQTNFIYVKNL